jgi:putative ABC transport system permease protein
MTLLVDAFRSLRRSKALTLAAVSCIALGSVATTGMATLVDATLLRPLPFPDADRLVRVWLAEADGDSRLSLSIPEANDLLASNPFETVLITSRVRAVGRLADASERLRGEAVNPGYFETLGLRAAHGRLLEPSDHLPDATSVMVISHGAWLRGFGGDPSVVGRPYRTERASYTIVGVGPRRFTGTVEDDLVDFWIPLHQYEPSTLLRDRDVRATWTIARLKPGSSAASTGSALDALSQSWRSAYPDMYRDRTLRIEPFGESWRARYRGGVAVLVVAAAVLLAIAATNVGCLLFARVIDRRRELAVRAALGADPRRLAVLLLVEAIVIVAAGGLAGAAAGPWALDAFLALSPVALPAYLELEPKGWTYAAAFAAIAGSSILAGFVPAIAGRSVRPGEVMKDGGRGTVGRAVERRAGAALVAAEVALTLTLLVTGGLLLRAYERLSTIDVGYRREGVVRLAVTFSRADAGPAAARAELLGRLRRAIASYPGVRDVGLVSPTLPPWDSERSTVRYDGLDPVESAEGVAVSVHQIDDGLLPTLGVAIVEGRNFTPADGPGAAPVAIVSRSLAERMGGPGRAIGRHVMFPPAASPIDAGGSFRVVGVASDVAWDGLVEQDTRQYIRLGGPLDAAAARHDVFVPLARFPVTLLSIAAATQGNARALVDPLRRRIAEIAPTSAVHWSGTLVDEVALEYAPSRFYAVLVVAFSCGALAVTSVGLFALLSHAAARRSAEMGVRLALGATPRQTAVLLLRGSLAPIAAGAALGAVGAAWAGGALGGLLYDVGLFDPWAFAGALGVLAVVALLAGAVPARRVASVDPLTVLRSDQT